MSNNSSDTGGGILNGPGGTVNVSDSSLSGNAAASVDQGQAGGGIYNSGSTVSMAATIVANTTSGGDCSGGVTDLGYNLTDDTTCGLGAPTDRAQPERDRLRPRQSLGELSSRRYRFGVQGIMPSDCGSSTASLGDDACVEWRACERYATEV